MSHKKRRRGSFSSPPSANLGLEEDFEKRFGASLAPPKRDGRLLDIEIQAKLAEEKRKEELHVLEMAERQVKLAISKKQLDSML